VAAARKAGAAVLIDVKPAGTLSVMPEGHGEVSDPRKHRNREHDQGTSAQTGNIKVPLHLQGRQNGITTHSGRGKTRQQSSTRPLCPRHVMNHLYLLQFSFTILYCR
jgi:hypothetical protein